MVSRWISSGTALDGLPFADRAWQYGDGLFETIAIRDGEPRLLGWHLERLATGCTRLGLQFPDPASIRADIDIAVQTAGQGSRFGVAKLVVTAGQGPRGYARAGATATHFVAVLPGKALERDCYRNGVAVRMCKTRLARQPQLAGIKSLNRLEQVLARNEWDTPAIFEGLTSDTAGNLICGTMSNVFIVADNEIVTPDLAAAGVAGIMRRKVLEVAHRHDIPIAVRDIPRGSLDDVREMFLTNSQFGVLPVWEFENRPMAVGDRTRSLSRQLVEAGIQDMAC